MRNLNNYFGDISLMMDGFMVKPCICDNVNERCYIVYKENPEFWEDKINNKNVRFRVRRCSEFIAPWIPYFKIYGDTNKFYELDEINYLVQKCVRWEHYATNGICFVGEDYFPARKEKTIWCIDFNVKEDWMYEPHNNGYKLLDVCYK